MIAVCLLTCDRAELTEESARTFSEHNSSRDDLTFLHADGGSATFANVNIARRYGFRTIFAPLVRVGQIETLNVFFAEVQRLGADWILWLENDWVSEHSLPSSVFLDQAKASVIQTVRLFGERKMKSGRRAPAGKHRMGTKEPIDWRPSLAFEGWEEGLAHWAGGGSLIQTATVRQFIHLSSLKEVMLRWNALRSLRPKQNLMWSIGVDTTPGFMA